MVGLAATATRVEANTSRRMNARIDQRTQHDVDAFRLAGEATIRRRLDELDREWDFERVVEVESPTMILTGLALGGLVDRRWLALPAFVGSMLLVHSLQGWYPLLPLFRRLGIRTRAEIDAERRELQRLLRERTGLAPGE